MGQGECVSMLIDAVRLVWRWKGESAGIVRRAPFEHAFWLVNALVAYHRKIGAANDV